MTNCKYFEVKNGDNKGHYIAIENSMSWEQQREIMGYRGFLFGAIQDYNINFYKHHGCYNKATIWLVSSYYVGHRLAQERLIEIKNTLTEKGFTFVNSFK